MNVHLKDISSTAEPFVTKLCMVMDQSAMQESRFAVFKFRVTVRAHMIKYMTISDIYIFIELLTFFTPKFSWMAHHYKLERCILLLLLCVCV